MKTTGFFMYPINFKGENNFLYLEIFKNQYGDPYYLFDKSMRCIIDIVHTKLEQILTSQNFPIILAKTLGSVLKITLKDNSKENTKK